MSFIRKIFLILFEFVETLVIAGAIFVIVYTFLFRLFEVNGDSMLSNFHNGEYVITNIITLRFSPLQRGDVIVFIAPPPNNEKDYIKRVIGLPGEKVLLKNGAVYINGKRLDESSYLDPHQKTYGQRFLSDNQEIRIPENSYFVLGDNRIRSSDSRDWGLVPKDQVIGVSSVIAWPPQNFKIVKEVDY